MRAIKRIFNGIVRTGGIIVGICLIPVIIVACVGAVVLYILNPEEERGVYEWEH